MLKVLFGRRSSSVTFATHPLPRLPSSHHRFRPTRNRFSAAVSVTPLSPPLSSSTIVRTRERPSMAVRLRSEEAELIFNEAQVRKTPQFNTLVSSQMSCWHTFFFSPFLSLAPSYNRGSSDLWETSNCLPHICKFIHLFFFLVIFWSRFWNFSESAGPTLGALCGGTHCSKQFTGNFTICRPNTGSSMRRRTWQ